MGDPKFSRRKYDTPNHPWRAERIKSEGELQKRFGLKNKREIWKAKTTIRTLRSQSRDLQARLRTGERQAEMESKQLLDKCGRLGLLPMEGTTLNDILSLTIDSILTRRFQTMVFQRGMAYTAEQARQFIVHGHISINGRVVTIPGYLVRRAEENAISFATSSPIANDLHPMRPKPKDAVEIEKEKAVQEQAAKAEPAQKPTIHKEIQLDKLKVVKPSLEKMIHKDGAEEEQKPLPEIEETGEIPQAPAEKPKGEKHKGEKAAEKHKGEKHKGEKSDKPEKTEKADKPLERKVKAKDHKAEEK
jgi:small subunit ribosomal protein S4